MQNQDQWTKHIHCIKSAASSGGGSYKRSQRYNYKNVHWSQLRCWVEEIPWIEPWDKKTPIPFKYNPRVPPKQCIPHSYHSTASFKVDLYWSIMWPQLYNQNRELKTMLIRSTGRHFDLSEAVGTQLKCKCAFRIEIPCKLGLSSDIKTSPFFQPSYFMLPATEQIFTHQLTVLCDLTVGLPDHAPVQFCSMMWCHQTQFYLPSCIDSGTTMFSYQLLHQIFSNSVVTVRLVPTIHLTHISPELKCHKDESWTVCSCSRQNCLQHHRYVASTLSSKVGAMCNAAQADLVQLCIKSLLSMYCKTC